MSSILSYLVSIMAFAATLVSPRHLHHHPEGFLRPPSKTATESSAVTTTAPRSAGEPPLPPTHIGVPVGVPIDDCTMTLNYFGEACAWDGTSTAYPGTTTAFREVDCHGCANVHVQRELFHCPQEIVRGSVTATTNSTAWSTVCAFSGETSLDTSVSPRRVTEMGSPTPIPPPQSSSYWFI